MRTRRVLGALDGRGRLPTHGSTGGSAAAGRRRHATAPCRQDWDQLLLVHWPGALQEWDEGRLLRGLLAPSSWQQQGARTQGAACPCTPPLQMVYTVEASIASTQSWSDQTTSLWRVGETVEIGPRTSKSERARLP